MTVPSASIKELARRLLAAEAGRPAADGEHEAERVCEKLRISLVRFAGADGFVALMRRALAISRVEAPSLQSLTLRADGCFVGFRSALGDDGNEAGAILTTHFLWLLATFVGEPMTMRLVREVWPDLSFDE